MDQIKNSKITRRSFVGIGATTLAAGALAMSGCSNGGSSDASSSEASESADGAAASEAPEQSTVSWNYGTSGNVLVTIANENGYWEDEGLTIEPVEATANADAMALLSTNKVNVVSNSGTSNPLQQISTGIDITVFGGHMLTGCMPVVGAPDCEWNGIESFVGKSVAVNPSYFAFTGALMDAGYENPLDEVDWQIYKDYNDAIAAVVRGDVAYALLGTGQTQSAKEMEEEGQLKIVCYQSDIMPNYSCCRMVAQTDWINDNPNTVKAICRALLRAQSWYEANKEEAVKLHAAAIDATEDYVAAYMLDEHYVVNVDPLKDGVERAWEILDKTGYLEEGNDINIDDHINTELYKAALDEAQSKWGSEDAAFYEKMQDFFAEHDA